jgi:hypothetical protein
VASIKILDPTAQRGDDNASAGPDAGRLAGKRIGFRLDQIWRCWDWISDDWAQRFRDAGAEVSYWRSTNRSGEEGEEQNRSLQEWLKTIDIAVVGLANCGSCTGWTVRDALAAANAGLPTVAVATQNFDAFAHEMARRGGRSGLRVHVLPYPLNERSREEVEPVAQTYFAGLLEVLGASLAEEKVA